MFYKLCPIVLQQRPLPPCRPAPLSANSRISYSMAGLGIIIFKPNPPAKSAPSPPYEGRSPHQIPDFPTQGRPSSLRHAAPRVLGEALCPSASPGCAAPSAQAGGPFLRLSKCGSAELILPRQLLPLTASSPWPWGCRCRELSGTQLITGLKIKPEIFESVNAPRGQAGK